VEWAGLRESSLAVAARNEAPHRAATARQVFHVAVQDEGVLLWREPALQSSYPRQAFTFSAIPFEVYGF
jgi:hypothetical protein